MSDSYALAQQGYVRFPRAWFSLTVSPQARYLLTILAGYADDDGSSWYSYEQLGDILGRSKAAVCKYVQELRDAGLIHTTQRTYGNGYNYRLIIRIIGWADVIRGMNDLSKAKLEQKKADADTTKPKKSKSPASASVSFVSKTERRIHDTERKDPKGPNTKNQITKTPRLTAMSEWSSEDEINWKKFRERDSEPFYNGNGTPEIALLEKVVRIDRSLKKQAGILTGPALRNLCESALKAFIERHDLENNEHALKEAVDVLASLANTPDQVQACMVALDKSWQPYWRRLSTPKQLAETCRRDAKPTPEQLADRQTIITFNSRAHAAEHWIRKLDTWKQRLRDKGFET